MMETKLIYQRAARYGVPMGLYLSLLSVAVVFSDRATPLPVLALVLIVCWPLAIYRIQRREHLAAGGAMPYAGLWLMGIMTVVCGSLICALATCGVITALRPDFIYEQMQEALNIYRQVPEMRGSEMLTVMQQATDRGMLPSPIEYVMQMFWLTSFAGSVISAVLAFVAMKLPARRGGKI